MVKAVRELGATENKQIEVPFPFLTQHLMHSRPIDSSKSIQIESLQWFDFLQLYLSELIKF